MAWCRCADDSDMSCSMQVGYDEGASTPARAAEPRPPRWRGSPARGSDRSDSNPPSRCITPRGPSREDVVTSGFFVPVVTAHAHRDHHGPSHAVSPDSCRPGSSRGEHGSPAGRSFIHTEDLVLAVPGLLDRPAASGCHRGRDHHEDGRDDDADDPPGPVNAARRRNTERGGEVVADEHTANPADNGEPERNVVAVARREELA